MMREREGERSIGIARAPSTFPSAVSAAAVSGLLASRSRKQKNERVCVVHVHHRAWWAWVGGGGARVEIEAWSSESKASASARVMASRLRNCWVRRRSLSCCIAADGGSLSSEPISVPCAYRSHDVRGRTRGQSSSPRTSKRGSTLMAYSRSSSRMAAMKSWRKNDCTNKLAVISGEFRKTSRQHVHRYH